MAQYQRTGRKLKRNHSNALPRYIISFDTETIRNEDATTRGKYLHSWRLGTAISGRLVGTDIAGAKAHKLHTPADFWKLVESLSAIGYTTWIVGHNILFDLIISEFPDRVERSEYVIDWPRSKRTREDNQEDNAHAAGLIVIDSPPTIVAMKCVATGGRIVFVDTMNWFPTTLRAIGDNLGYPKYDMPGEGATEQDWFSYCFRDSEIVFRAFHKLIKWVKSNNMGMFRYTAPSQAMAAFRHRFMRHEILFHDNANAKKLERQSYFGGRTEVFRIGRIAERVHQLDANSLFPSIMHAGKFPSSLVRSEFSQSYSSTLPCINWEASIAEVELKTNESIFPYRMEKGIVYPIGRFTTVLSGPELWQAKRMGYVRRVRSWCEYRLEPLFVEFVETLWDMRQTYQREGNKIYEQFAKRMLNSLYGKFGQRSAKWVNVPNRLDALPWDTWTEKCPLTNDPTQFRSFGWQVQKKGELCEIENTFPAISSFVTSTARLRMNCLRQVAGRKNLYYQGVDSLIVTEEGLSKLILAGEIDQSALGKLRLDLTVDDGVINGCADYQLGEKIVISGKTLDIVHYDRDAYYQRKFFGLQYLFQNAPLNTISEEHVPWRRVSGYAKGIIQPDNWVKPLEIWENEEMDIKLKTKDGSDPNTSEAAKYLGILGFTYVEDENDKKAGVALYRNQGTKGLDASAIRKTLTDNGEEVAELA